MSELTRTETAQAKKGARLGDAPECYGFPQVQVLLCIGFYNKLFTCRNPYTAEDELDAYPTGLPGGWDTFVVSLVPTRLPRPHEAAQLVAACLACPNCVSQKPSVFSADLL